MELYSDNRFFSDRFPKVVYDRVGRQQKALKILSVLSDFLGGRLGQQKVLDIGCASGIISNFIADHVYQIVGTDVDIKSVLFANREKKPNAHFFPSDAQELPFLKECFHIVICAHVYEHVRDARTLLREIHRVLKPEGICFFAAGNRLSLIEPHYRLPLLSLLPRPLAGIWLRLIGKGRRYEEKHLTYWGLRRLLADFCVIDYTGRVIDDPEKFAATDLVSPGSVKQRMGKMVYRIAPWLAPTYIFLLRKK
jgi:SAM-dependent methyltransferase